MVVRAAALSVLPLGSLATALVGRHSRFAPRRNEHPCASDITRVGGTRRAGDTHESGGDMTEAEVESRKPRMNHRARLVPSTVVPGAEAANRP